ncbi:hypothetical protein PEX1_006810 [Penicillium expansum]|nr:hypothetical protein PEX1_006810 [Penicillium expansum]
MCTRLFFLATNPGITSINKNLPDPKDPDGDSTMTSSIDSIRPDDSARTGARTPTGIAQASSAGVDVSELSPPGSQTKQEAGASVGDIGTTLEQRGGQPTEKMVESNLAAWKSKRAQEDYQRATEYLVDKDFKLDEFGDPFDERDLAEKLP